MSQPMTPLHLRDWLVARMRVSIEQYEHDPNKRAGCLEGADLCSTITSLEQLDDLLRDRAREEHRLVEELRVRGSAQATDYWRYRCATGQLEFLRQRMVFAWLDHVSSAPVSAIRDLALYVTEMQLGSFVSPN